MAFSDNGSCLAIHDTSGVTVHDYLSGTLMFKLTGLRPSQCAYSPNGRFLACHGYKDADELSDSTASLVQIWDISRHEQICRSYELLRDPEIGGLVSLKFAPDSLQLAVIRDDGLVSVIQLATGQVVHIEGPSKRFYDSPPSCAFLPRSDTLIYTHLNEQIKMAYLNSGRAIVSPKSVEESTFAWNELIGVRPFDQKLLVLSGHDDDYHNRIDALDVRNGARVPFISGERGYMWCPRNVTLSPSGDYLAASVLKESRSFLVTQPSYAVTVWDVRTGHVIRDITTDKPTSEGLVSSIFSLAFSPRGFLLVGRKDSVAQVPIH